MEALLLCKEQQHHQCGPSHHPVHCIHYTDNYTGNIIVKVNVTETHFTSNNQGNVLCPMYQVSAWNAGGEGELSEPVQESTPQGKQAKNLLN